MIKLTQTKRLKSYKPILEGLVEDFGYIYYHAILVWCGILDNSTPNDIWQVYLIKNDEETVGICGLYSLDQKTIEELWLGWFGILPDMRNKGLGSEVLKQLEIEAIKMGANYIYSYVDQEGKPLDFYYKNGFERIGTVNQYIESTNFKFDKENFESLEDHVIKKKLDERSK